MKNSDLIVILGSSDNPMRPSFLANKLLKNKGFNTITIPHRVDNSDQQQLNPMSSADSTIAIFLKPNQQKKYYDYMLSLKPSRIIFNPGTDNDELKEIAKQHNIRVISGCTIALVMNSLI
ncbi:MAG TPA: CoA-binding protein [Chitinophagaceae bacterium]|nr:CoA-binding protein [Chitinophagaceae bacterium]